MVLHEDEGERFSYNEIVDIIKEMWNYKDFGDLSVEDVFLCGSLWGGIKLVESYQRRKKEQKTMDTFADMYENKEWFFKAIYDHPGIRHKDLAEAGGVSTSHLSQIVPNVEKEGLITYNRVGREKYYYLRKQGEMVFQKIKEKKKI